MALPTFFPLDDDCSHQKQAMKPNEAAVRLGISRGSLDKLIAAGILSTPISSEVVEKVARRPRLGVQSGELTVLRTAARAEAYDEDRKWIGFHIAHTDDEVAETSLRWWRCDPDKVIDNQLYAVTVSTVPVAVFAIAGVVDSYQRPTETGARYHFRGTMLARIGSGPRNIENVIGHGTTANPIMHLDHHHDLYDRVHTIMNSRITVNSGGPIGYLDAQS